MRNSKRQPRPWRPFPPEPVLPPPEPITAEMFDPYEPRHLWPGFGEPGYSLEQWRERRQVISLRRALNRQERVLVGRHREPEPPGTTWIYSVNALPAIGAADAVWLHHDDQGYAVLAGHGGGPPAPSCPRCIGWTFL